MHSDGNTRRIAVVYAARSRPDETGSIQDQLRECREWASGESREVFPPEGFSDEARSAYTGPRGEGLVNAKRTAAALARDGHDIVLVATETDRLARGDGRHAPHLLNHFLEALRDGYRLEAVNEDMGGEMGLVLAALYGSRNHKDSKSKAAHVARGKRRSAERGDANGGYPNYGYRYGRWREGEKRVAPRRT